MAQQKKGNDKEIFTFNSDGSFTTEPFKIKLKKKSKPKKKHDIKTELDNTRLDMIQ
jgi:hypothetical protein